MTAGGFDVFDCHHHVGDVAAFVGLDGAPADGTAAEMAARLAMMDAAGVRQAAVIPGHNYPRPDGIADTRAVNDRIAAYRDARPDRFPVAIGIVEPQHVDRSLAEIDRCRDELRLAGLSFHARFQGVSVDDRWVLRYVQRMAAVGLVPVLHALAESPDEALWKVAVVARSAPEQPMLVLDAFAAFESTREVMEVAEACPNLLFDTSLAYNADFVVAAVGRHGAERFVFGTDLYSPPVGRRISHVLGQLVASELSDAQKAAVLGGNARRLFGVG